jgi:hypothetical protein
MLLHPSLMICSPLLFSNNSKTLSVRSRTTEIPSAINAKFMRVALS